MFLVYEIVDCVCLKLDGDKVLIGFCGVFWIVVFYVIEGCGGMDKSIVCGWVYINFEFFNWLLDFLIEVSV